MKGFVLGIFVPDNYREPAVLAFRKILPNGVPVWRRGGACIGMSGLFIPLHRDDVGAAHPRDPASSTAS